MTMLQRLASSGEQIGDEVAQLIRSATERNDPGPRWLPVAMWTGVGIAVGALATFLLDPARGRSRRARLLDQAAGTIRRGAREAGRISRRMRSDVGGRITAMQHAGEGDPFPDDVTLASRVQSELFRDPEVPKGAINVNVERGIVVLRGEVPDEAMRGTLVSRVETMPGVWAVRNLLHLPGEAAPSEAAATAQVTG